MPGGPTFQLVMASLAVEELLLQEYDRTHDRLLYLRAKERILAFAQWESQQREPVAFLWNDHAISGRISVLVRLWLTLRDDPETTAEQRAELIAFVERSGELLAKSSQFTVRTNHGVMQNLALLQVCAAFSDLPKASTWRALAMDRLAVQMGFYVSDEGVVLEHSSEYHLFGNLLMGYAQQLARLNQIEVPANIVKAQAATTEFTRRMMRPDGSLPLVGNTAGGHHDMTGAVLPEGAPAAPSPAPAAAGSFLYPLSGYAIWQDVDPAPAQTFVAWAKHDRHGHKHADEPSVHWWSQGVAWITAAGYWPYGERGHEQANGWQGSNAPHAVGEAMLSARSVRLMGAGESGPVRAIDIENLRTSGFGVRRQILQLAADQMLVLDVVRGATAPVETLWTLDPRLTLESSAEGRFISSAAEQGQRLQIALARDDKAAPELGLYRGSWSPFAGWVVMGRQPQPAPALRVQRASGDSMTATLFTVGKDPTALAVSLAPGAQADQWDIDIQGTSGPQHVQRRRELIELTSPQGKTQMTMKPAPELAERQQTLRAAMTRAIDRYPQWRELGVYQQRVYIAIAVLWLVMEVVALVLRRRLIWVQTAAVAGWAAFACWVHFFYLV
jgi:hypothetical protein